MAFAFCIHSAFETNEMRETVHSNVKTEAQFFLNRKYPMWISHLEEVFKDRKLTELHLLKHVTEKTKLTQNTMLKNQRNKS